MDSRIKTIADHYGYEAQSRQCMEECAELIQAINKLWRAETFDLGDLEVEGRATAVVGEMADVQIMLWQMQHALGVYEEQLDEEINSKLERQMQRIKEKSK